MSKNEAFSDYENNRNGIFGDSEGLQEVDRAKTRFDKNGQGYVVESFCERCGQQMATLISWPEIIFIAHGRVPAGWVYDRGAMRPNQGCPAASCRFPIPFTVTVDECQRAVGAGLSAGTINQQQVQAIAAQAAATPTAR